MRRSFSAGSFACACGALLALLPGAAHADASSAVAAARAEQRAPGLNWVRLEGAESCISAAQLAQRIEARVGRVLFTSVSEAALFVDGSVRRAGDGWDVILEVSRPDGAVLGRRSLRIEGESCALIDDAVTLVIAVTLNPDSGLIDAGIPLDPDTAASLETLFGAEPSELDPASLPRARVQPTHDANTRAKPVARSRAPSMGSEPWSLSVDLAGAASLGQLPNVALGAALQLLIAPPRAWPIALGAFLLPAQTTRVDGGAAEARFDLIAGTLALCPWQPSWLPSLSLCIGGELGRLRARPSDFASENRSASDAVANLIGLALFRPQLSGDLRARLALIPVLPLIQRSYEYQTVDRVPAQLFRMPQFALRAELGLGWDF